MQTGQDARLAVLSHLDFCCVAKEAVAWKCTNSLKYVVKRVLRYIGETTEMGIMYCKESGIASTPAVFNDSDWAARKIG